MTAATIIPIELPSKEPVAAPMTIEMSELGTIVREVVTVELMAMEVKLENEAGQLVRAELQTTTVVHLTGLTVTVHEVHETEAALVAGLVATLVLF